ncbi:hypothetical protein [Agreia sp. Leaf210]|uniref:hypothetical protein n=1 Tax=Agreia sp. Leaf210 TaxID=1735682 RepID=UPI0006F49551|nr:hypothetical protein [Agreia sp. Leaf210]KQM58336.1 hypothetical protein ASE64_12550 [Agreia sp. Leaf210]
MVIGDRRESDVPDKHDAGAGSLADYTYNLFPRFTSVTLKVAGSSPFQNELTELQEALVSPTDAFVERRPPAEDRVDAPMPVRLWMGSELSGVVGFVPRGLEAPVDACLGRLSDRGKAPRIPCDIVVTRHGLRVVLRMGRAY